MAVAPGASVVPDIAIEALDSHRQEPAAARALVARRHQWQALARVP
jgi:hypothetical protein